MAYDVTMPQLGLTMEEGTITSWKVKVGDKINKGDVLLQIETDKLTSDVLSEYSGVLIDILAQEGDTVAVKGLLGHIGEPGEKIQSPDVEVCVDVNGRVRISPLARRTAKELGVDYSDISGTGPNERIVKRDVVKKAAELKQQQAAEPKMSPLAAKVANEAGIDPRNVPAQGRVMAADIMAFLENSRDRGMEKPREERIPMNGMRRAIAKNMLNSHMTSPTVTFNLGVDMSEMKRYREQLKSRDIKVSYTDLLVKFVSKALMEYPLLNCSVEDNTIVYKHYVNMGVAVALDNGLLVPNIPDADKKGLQEISSELKLLAGQAREGGLSPERLKGGTFTITNLGMYGIESFTPIINQPEVAILGVTTIEDKVVVRNGEMVIRPIMNLSLTADHRVADGSVAAEFLQRVKALLENPALMLA